MELQLTLIAVIILALFFDFTNGFHDSANAIATSVSTRALTPRVAVLMAAVLNFIGAFISIEVATTVGKGVVDTGAVTINVVLAGVVGAIVWNLITWSMGLPSSSSHALIGGVAGAGIAAAGFDAVLWSGITQKVLIPSLVSIFAGATLAGLLVLAIMWTFRRTSPGLISRRFRRLQIVSAGFVALTHGTNDAQKTMGVIALALVAANPGAPFQVPLWVIGSAAVAMGLGTWAGGWRIIRTLGRRITHLEPYQGFAAETATAAILFTTANYGFPVSTTHTISGSVLGAGAARKAGAVRWGVARSMLAAWLFTFPAAGLVAAAMMTLTRLPGGTIIVFALAVLISAGIGLIARARSAPSILVPALIAQVDRPAALKEVP
ncbi:MAG: inorganic phosphate transporter [Longispora sp.]|nr:inorganic phosphate transporter [Longispora sp. (in: high G+C Gram-positive bacteria)]